MKTIGVMNEKGGVGKTSCSVHLAAGLHEMGLEVLLIDADPQGHATLLTGFQPSAGFYGWLTGGALAPTQWHWYEKRTANLIPGNAMTQYVVDKVPSALWMRECLNGFEGVVIVDTAPAPSALNALILMAVDAVIIPTTPEPLSFEAVRATIKHIEGAATPRYEAGLPPITLLGILPTMVDVRTSIHKAEMESLAEAYPGKLYKPFHRRAVWSEAARFSQRLWEYNPMSPASAQVLDWVETVKGQIE